MKTQCFIFNALITIGFALSAYAGPVPGRGAQLGATRLLRSGTTVTVPRATSEFLEKFGRSSIKDEGSNLTGKSFLEVEKTGRYVFQGRQIKPDGTSEGFNFSLPPQYKMNARSVRYYPKDGDGIIQGAHVSRIVPTANHPAKITEVFNPTAINGSYLAIQKYFTISTVNLHSSALRTGPTELRITMAPQVTQSASKTINFNLASHNINGEIVGFGINPAGNELSVTVLEGSKMATQTFKIDANNSRQPITNLYRRRALSPMEVREYALEAQIIKPVGITQLNTTIPGVTVGR
ncbi:MAG: hypothetical protein V4736_09020 [Bdellovibrionota bacterium]